MKYDWPRNKIDYSIKKTEQKSLEEPLRRKKQFKKIPCRSAILQPGFRSVLLYFDTILIEVVFLFRKCYVYHADFLSDAILFQPIHFSQLL